LHNIKAYALANIFKKNFFSVFCQAFKTLQKNKEVNRSFFQIKRDQVIAQMKVFSI